MATDPEIESSSQGDLPLPALEHATPDTQYQPDQGLLNDVKRVFSGAPHFMLERAQDGKLYPQVIFPWDQDQGIQDLWDRQPLRHTSFTLSTLHAHLPVPDDWSGGRPRTERGKASSIGGKRATFDIGVFEVPNMLGRSTREHGCIAYRTYMELPIADSRAERRNYLHLRYHRKPSDTSTKEAARRSEGELSSPLDHKQWVIHEGASTRWGRIGVRNPNMRTITERLQRLQVLRDEIVQEGRFTTLLDEDSSRSLYKDLFGNFLYPPAKLVDFENPYSIKTQIEVLTDVLAIENAWIDFSLVEWRVRLGQILFDNPEYGSEDFAKRLPRILEYGPGVERKWLLIQLLLSAELLLRLDAAVQVGIFRPSKELSVTSRDIHRFNTMRTPKVNWDLVVVRRVFDNLSVQFSTSEKSDEIAGGLDPDSPVTHVFELGFSDNKILMDMMHDETSWNCLMLPRNPKQQIDGLLVFARSLHWPNIDEFEEEIKAKLEFSETQLVTPSRVYGTPVHKFALDRCLLERKRDNEQVEGPLDQHDQPFRGFVRLHAPEDPRNSTALDTGGWLSRAWLTGVVLPGESIEHILMSTLLENDPESMEKVGPLANLFGGFILDNRSWWSKSCIVGRVISCLDGTSECMGWISSPVIPRNSKGDELDNGWLDVEAKKATTKVFPSKKRTRILDGVRVALESSPLGMDEKELSTDSFSLPIDNIAGDKPPEIITFQHLTLSSSEEVEKEGPEACSRKGDEKPFFCFPSVTFTFKSTKPSFAPFAKPETISFPLIYNVHFIAAHPCRPPRGVASNKRGSLSSLLPHISRDDHFAGSDAATSTVSLALPPSPRSPTSPSVSSSQSHIPAHPLHASYPYLHIPLSSLSSLLSPTSLSSPSVPATTSQRSSTSKANQEPLTPTTKMETVYILEARKSKDAELFVRAWCATTGNDAIIGRTGRTCLSCCIREARAVGVKVVIRIGA